MGNCTAMECLRFWADATGIVLLAHPPYLYHMIIVTIDCNHITGWDSFHDVFKNTFGFPDYYGKNMNAWIDCMSNPDSDFSNVFVSDDEPLTLFLQNIKSFRQKCPDIYDAIIECSAFVNYRRLDIGEQPYLLLSFYE